MICPHCKREIHRLRGVDLYKTQMGFYKLRNGNFAFVHSFGTQSGWGLRISDIDSSQYTWNTRTGVCIYRNGKPCDDPNRDIVEYIGMSLPIKSTEHKRVA